MEKAPVIVQRQGGAVEAAALLGVMSSIPFDWYMRRWVELKLYLSNFSIPARFPWWTSAHLRAVAWSRSQDA